MFSDENNTSGINDIEKILSERRAETVNDDPPKKYYRRNANQTPVKAPDDGKTIIMKNVNAEPAAKPAGGEVDVKSPSPEKNNVGANAAALPKQSPKSEVRRDKATPSGDGAKVRPKNEGVVTSRAKAAESRPEYNPLITENDDLEIDENPEEPTSPESGAIGALTSVVKAIIYLAAVLAVSITLASIFISVANDVFAFVKDETPVEVTVPENCDLDTLAELLHDSGAIKYPKIFKLFVNIKKLDKVYDRESGTYKDATLVAGDYSISPMLNYMYMYDSFLPKKAARTEVLVTIPEGYTVDQIIKLLTDKGIGTYEGYVRAINEYDYDYRFLDELEENISSDRYWRLEGYLYPDTYYFYSTSTEETVIYKMLENFNNKFTDEYYARAEELGMTVDEVITLASMIQKEVRYADEFGNVSSVFHNRLNNQANFPHLDSDATIVYAIEHDSGTRPEKLTSTDYDSPYNTYKCIGLPPGPITNPAIEAIRYALYPNSTGYYYFVSGDNGRTVFSRTYAEHQKAIAELYSD